MRFFVLAVLFGIINLGVLAQSGNADTTQILQARQLITHLEELEDPMIKLPDWYMTFKDVYKGRDKLIKNLKEVTDDYSATVEEEDYTQLLIQSTNASLWYAEVTSEGFQIFMRRFVTGRPISKDVIDEVRNSYVKWIEKPSIKNLDRYSQLLLDAGKSYEILTKLQVTTSEEENIQIKYHPINAGEVETLTGPVAEKSVPVGNYYLWLEKDGKILSSRKEIFPCITGWTKINLETLY